MNILQRCSNLAHRLNTLLCLIFKNFIEDGCIYRAGALAFATILAIVPLMTVGLAIFSSFPVFQNLKTPLQNFIFTNFVPTTGEMVQDYLQQFVNQVANLSTFGVGFLIFTAILVMFTIERAMNTIWRVHVHRESATAILLYWAILSLTPIFLGFSLAISSYLTSLSLFLNQPISNLLFNLAPFLLSFIGFTFLYVVVPNKPVRLSHGMIGGGIAAILFESAKQAFAFYLTHYNFYALLYGAFATVPVFFMWVYWVWIITLLGAEVSYALSLNLRHHADNKTPTPGFLHALIWLDALWAAQQKGLGLNLDELISSNNHPYEVNCKDLLKLLSKANLIHQTKNDEYRLSKNMDQITMSELNDILPYRLPRPEDIQISYNDKAQSWSVIFSQQQQVISDVLQLSLEKLFSNKT